MYNTLIIGQKYYKTLYKKITRCLIINKKYILICIVLSLLTLNVIPSTLFVAADKPSKPRLTFSWKEATFSYSMQRIWEGDSVVIDYAGTYQDTYETETWDCNTTTDIWIRGRHTIFHEANYSCVSNHTIIGNLTFSIDFQVYLVEIDYGSNVKVIWVALKQGVEDVSHYLTSHLCNFSYYEEYHQVINSQFTKINATPFEVIDTWNDSSELNGTKNYNYFRNNTYWPYFLKSETHREFTSPLILTIQIFTSDTNDRIAWVNMIQDFIIFQDKDLNGVFSVANEDSGGIPRIETSNEKVGSLIPYACDLDDYYAERQGGIFDISQGRYIYPIDKTVSEIAAQIQFTPPTSNSETDVSWGITYPNFPTYAKFMDYKNQFRTKHNSSFIHSCPSDYSYKFDYSVTENYTNLDITYDLGKISNTTLYDYVQGSGLMIPQYNFFLSSFDINEIDSKFLTLPCDLFSFESNDTVVAEINMGGIDKKNYTLFDFPALDKDSTLESKGSSIHPLVVAFDELYSFSETPFINTIYSLKTVVEQDPTFNVVDSLYRLQGQNYPVWSGERLRHDPTLTIYYKGYEVGDDGTPGFIPGYNILLVGTVGIITLVIVSKKRKKFSK
ncbi:MAG: hypothetical protein ACFFB8_01660 [Promethearchaeota archaeon]